MDTIPAEIPQGEQVVALNNAVQGMGYGKHRYRGPKPPFGAIVTNIMSLSWIKRWNYLHLLGKRTIDCNGGSHSAIWLFGRRIWKVSGLICTSEAVKGKMKARE